MGRDVVEIRGNRIDPGKAADIGGAGGSRSSDAAGSAGNTAGGAGNPEVVLDPLAREIRRVGTEGGLRGLSEVQCYLAARWVVVL